MVWPYRDFERFRSLECCSVAWLSYRVLRKSATLSAGFLRVWKVYREYSESLFGTLCGGLAAWSSLRKLCLEAQVQFEIVARWKFRRIISISVLRQKQHKLRLSQEACRKGPKTSEMRLKESCHVIRGLSGVTLRGWAWFLYCYNSFRIFENPSFKNKTISSLRSMERIRQGTSNDINNSGISTRLGSFAELATVLSQTDLNMALNRAVPPILSLTRLN